MPKEEIELKRYSSNARVPLRATSCFAGFELYSAKKLLFVLFLKN